MGASRWNLDWTTHKASDLAATAGVKLTIKGTVGLHRWPTARGTVRPAQYRGALCPWPRQGHHIAALRIFRAPGATAGMTRTLPRWIYGRFAWVPSSSQLACRCGDADLEIGRWLAAERVPVDWRALRSGCRARRGVVDQRVAGRSGPWRGAGEQFSEIIGVRHACSQVARVPGACGPREQPVMPIGLVECVGTEPQQNRLDDRCVIEKRRGYRARLDPRRDDQRRYPHAVASEHLRVVVGRAGRRDVIEEAAVLVIEDDQHRFSHCGLVASAW
jgi:hypothetical protein